MPGSIMRDIMEKQERERQKHIAAIAKQKEAYRAQLASFCRECGLGNLKHKPSCSFFIAE